MKTITILIADDHTLIREAWAVMLNNIPEFSVVAESDSGEDTIKLAGEFKPDIVIMDINLKGMNGITATPLVLEVSPLSKVLALSMHKQLNFVSQMMKAGAMGYVTKDSTATELKMAILKIHGGDKYICEDARHRLAENLLFGNKDEEKLTKREIEITDYVKKGNSSKDIAEALGIAVKTVEVHRSHILKKLKLKNSVSLVNYINIQQMQF